MKILVLNAGSSSQKSELYEIGDQIRDASGAEQVGRAAGGQASSLTACPPLWSAQIDWRQAGQADITVKFRTGEGRQESWPSRSHAEDVRQLLQSLLMQPDGSWMAIDAVGHRVVHGGRAYQTRTRVTAEVKAAIAELADLAPAHNPANLEGITVIESLLGPDIPQFAVFDTAFHSHLSEAAAIYPGPYAWVDQDIRRYGFHGISHQYCAHRTAEILGRDLRDLRLVICHLGNGCSLSAVRDGQSVDTTMGFTPLDGLMMGTRSGSVDPGILLYLLRHGRCTAEELDQVLNKESGLKGISGVSGDVREVLAAIAAGNARAQLALDMYVHRLRSQIGAMLASLGGMDALVFTAGVGENSPLVRAAACEAFAFLGLQVDPVLNQDHPVDREISMVGSAVRVVVVHTQEDWAIARECWQALREASEKG